jgi:phosphoenolpyruvate carboxylase
MPLEALTMSQRDVFPAKDAALRDDVRTLGALVGEMLREQGGEELFQAVEAARLAAIERRQTEKEDGALFGLVGGRPPDEAAELVRAFSAYFQVVNLAETVHRLRRTRDYQREVAEGGEPQPGSLSEAVRHLRDAGVSLAEVMELLGRMLVEPVFTAHPSEAVRRTILEKQQRIARRLVERMDPSRTPAEERAALERIRAEVTTAWQTEEHPSQRPTVADEREHVLFYVNDILYRVIPPFYEALQDALAGAYGEEARGLTLPTLLRFASWVGGDMDGNPNVTAETIVATLVRHREMVLGRYRSEVQDLARQLSQSQTRVEVDPDVLERGRRYAETFPQAAAAVPPRHRDMPYRVLLRLMAERLEATYRDKPAGYAGIEGYLDDLRAIAGSLERHQGEHAGLFAVRRAIRRAETFGFHLATLDVRQDARLLRGLAPHPPAPSPIPSHPPGEGETDMSATLAVFAAIRDCRQRFGPHAIGPYIVSMTQSAGDVLLVLDLARRGGLEGSDGEVPLDVAPLFETVPDLEAAPGILRELLRDEAYRRHLAGRGNRQMVMIGYSDSNKEGGIAASRWALQQAQGALADVAHEEGVDLTLFHGRGGSASRGGGKVHRAVLAAPRGTVGGRLRLTEQGESINAKYGLRGIALRTLEQSAGAVALATAAPPPPDPREPAWTALMDEIARDSRATYRALVYGEPDFFAYFRAATPIDVIERMPIGSRPASRRSGEGIENLRAIPWVFAWTQSRHILPGWYGLGTGLDAAVARHGEATVAAMIRDWPFAHVLLEDAEMVLAKADMPIAARYAELAGEVGERFFPVIRAEFERTTAWLLRLKGSAALLDEDPTLQRSIRLRNPYVDPMSFLQVDLLRRWRDAGRPDGADDELFRALLDSVNGIARGLQNTG